MKKLLTILGTLSISVPVTLSVSAFSVQENSVLPTAESEKWGTSNYLDGQIAEGDAFAVYAGKMDGSDFDYLIKTDIKNGQILVQAPNENGDLVWRPFITKMNTTQKYNQIFVKENNLYFTEAYNAKISTLFKIDLSSKLNSSNFSEIQFENIINEHETVEFKGIATNSLFDNKTGNYIVGTSTSANIYNIGSTPKQIKELSNAEKIFDGKTAKSIIQYGGENILIQKPQQKDNLIFVKGNAANALVETVSLPNVNSVALAQDGDILMADGNRIYKVSPDDMTTSLTLDGKPYSEVTGVKNISDINFDGTNLKLTSDAGIADYTKPLFNGDVINMVDPEKQISNLNLANTTAIQAGNKTYYISDDHQKVSLVRDYATLSSQEMKIAFDQNVNSYGDAKKQIIEAVVKNASGLTLNEAYTYVKFSENDFKSLQYGNSTSDWYKEKTITVSGPFKQDLKVNISRYNSQVPENLSVSVATQVSQTNITDTNKINEIVNDVNKKIGPNLEVVNPPVSIDLTNSTSATFSIKSKDGLNIPTQIQKSINVTFTNLKLPEVTASLKDTSFNDGVFVGETVVYDLEGVETPKGTIENANYEGTITGKQLSVTFKKAGRQTISIKDANFDLKTKLTVNVLENKISAKGFNGSVNIRNEKSKTFQVDNYKLFNTVQIQSATFKDGETAQISSYSQSYDKETGKLTITGNGAGEVVNVQLSGQTVRGTSLTSDKFALQVSIPKQMPLWIIILLIVLLVLLLSVGGYFIWWKFFRSEFQKRQPRYAAIAADKHAVSKAKKTETAKLKKDKGIVRSGLFERELEYNLDKLNDPDYESKYVWINEGRVEDMDPVLNNWDDKKLGSKKPSNKKDPQLESRLQNVKKSVKK